MSELTVNTTEINQSDIKIEKALHEDAPAIFEVQRATWLATYPNEELGISQEDIRQKLEGNNGENTAPKIERWRQSIESAGEQNQVFVARWQSKVVGFIAPRIMEGQNRVGALYVLPEVQGRGVGSRLTRQAIDWYGPRKDIYLHVASYNDKAIAFYEHFGFHMTGKNVTDQSGQLGNGKTIPEIEMMRQFA